MMFAFAIVAIVTIALYMNGVHVMTSQNLKYLVDVGSLPVNALLFYFLAGYASDKIGKGRPRWVGWAVFAVGMIITTLVFRVFGGYRTVFG